MGSVSSTRVETFDMRSGAPLIAMDQDAEPASSSPPLAHFDACPTWLELAVRHLSDAQVARDARITAWRDGDERSKTGALEWEFETSMQATMASAIAVDAFYAVVQSRVHLPQSLIDEWRDKQTPRHIRISE